MPSVLASAARGLRGIGRLAFLLAVLTTPAWSAQRVVIGLAGDGPTQRDVLPVEALEREVLALLGGEFDVSLPASARRSGNWTLAGAEQAVQNLLADPNVDIVLATGLLTSHAAARVVRPAKPLIATLVVDAALQGFPLVAGASGRRNFAYVASFRSVEEEIAAFQNVKPFKHLAILVDRAVITAIPELGLKAPALARALDATVSIVPLESDVESLLGAIPPLTDAVYVGPLRRLPPADIGRLADGLIQARLPSLSAMGRSEVQLGMFMSVGGLPTENTRFARRIALNIQSVLLGEDAGQLPVAFRLNKRYVFNMRTARALGFLPRWAVLVDAERLFDREYASGPPLTLRAAMLETLQSNPALEAVRLELDLASADVDLARASLLPQLDISASAARIDADRASPLGQAEATTDAQLSGRQLLYSEQAWAGYRVAAYLQAASGSEIETAVLDTLAATANAYLATLRALALEDVRKSNLEVTRANLELARLREKIGASGRADVLRWESQIANDRQSLLSAEADRRRAGVELNRVVSRPQHSAPAVGDVTVSATMAVMTDPRFDAFVGNPAVWETFQQFSVANALANAPELGRIDALIDAQQRQITAARRAHYVPDVALVANGGRNLNESGAGTGGIGIPGLSVPDDESWSIALQASLPLFAGGALKADSARARYGLRQLEVRRRATAEEVEARVRSALHGIGASFPSIELSDAAAAAGAANLALVIDAYSQGAVSITDLIDAQNAALTARLAAAQARYTFLIDYVAVLRATGNFDLLLGTETADQWYTRIASFFELQGVEPLRR